MEITFAGAAREVTGSCHLVRVAEKTIALDCGMFQGRRSESEKKNRELPAPVDSLSALVLSHAHIDHAGRLPFLVRNGFGGPIYCTPATRDLCAYMLMDSAYIQEKDAEHLARHGKQFVEPLYERRDVARTMELMVGVAYGREFTVTPNIRAAFVDAGHILGSASVVLDCRETSTRFLGRHWPMGITDHSRSGDAGRREHGDHGVDVRKSKSRAARRCARPTRDNR
jgi:metallo-beta-lactamase family protein